MKRFEALIRFTEDIPSARFILFDLLTEVIDLALLLLALYITQALFAHDNDSGCRTEKVIERAVNHRQILGVKK